MPLPETSHYNSWARGLFDVTWSTILVAMTNHKKLHAIFMIELESFYVIIVAVDAVCQMSRAL